MLLTCAAILELNTPPSERWRIQTNYLRGHNHRLVFLDLAKGDHAEALRGMMLLNTMLG
ncbi:hypothetical protein A176_005488 [Myxococcus hansupus]|uniref:Uncharacterized protein n=1 Tax=Pseudomyxococcus hansupus TaxID=1297742 RepID=A0A0H4WYR3_9BACT|nr:hypothetical protein A176_005488 [Myxococcus hansupus]